MARCFEAEKKLKNASVKAERRKVELVAMADKFSLEKSSLTAEVIKANQLLTEEKNLRLQAEEKGKTLEEEVKRLQANLASKQAKVDFLRTEKIKVVTGIPSIVQKFIHSPEFQQPLSRPFNACIQLGRHQACCRVLTEDPGFDRAKLGNFYDENVDAQLQTETDGMFLGEYPFLESLSARANEPSEVLLSLEPASKE